MSAPHTKGAASVAPIAAAFLAIGGRIMVNPTGDVETMINPLVIIGRTVRKRDRRLRRESMRALVRAEVYHSRELARLAAANGADHGNGWVVWQARA